MKFSIKNSLKNKKATVMGLGLHGGGVSVVNWLLSKGAKVLITDLKSKEELKNSISKIHSQSGRVTFVLGQHRKQDFITTDFIVKNPGVNPNSKYLKLAKKVNIQIISDIGLFLIYNRGKIIAITGTKGKSTTAALIFSILKKKNKNTFLAGNIRKSPLDFLEKINTKSYVVLELSSWQLEDLYGKKLNSKIAVVTNIYPDHLIRHKTLNNYVKAKLNIFSGQTNKNYSILNYDNLYTRRMRFFTNGKVIWFSKKQLKFEKYAVYDNKNIFYVDHKIKKIIIKISELQLLGNYNIYNIMAAIATAKALKVPDTIIKKSIAVFRGLKYRMEKIRKFKSITFYNNTTATNPDSAITALKSVNTKITLIAGGTDDSLRYRDFSQEIACRTNYCILLKGSASDKIIKYFKIFKFQNFITVNNMNAAIKKALENAEPNSIVLLSPGAKSFGLFKNEFDRGDQFNAIVNGL